MINLRLLPRQVAVVSDATDSAEVEGYMYTNLDGTVPTTSEYGDRVTIANRTARIVRLQPSEGAIYGLLVGSADKKTDFSVFITSQKDGTFSLKSDSETKIVGSALGESLPFAFRNQA